LNDLVASKTAVKPFFQIPKSFAIYAKKQRLAAPQPKGTPMPPN
jgi:hypothetical protein